MRNFKVALAAACAVVVGWAFTASAEISASAYVQDGLIAQWDGIENAGAGLAHDDAATTWVNLVEGATDATLPEGLFTVTPNSIVFNKGRAFAEGITCASNTTPITIEAHARASAAPTGANDLLYVNITSRGGLGFDARAGNGYAYYQPSSSAWGTQKSIFKWWGNFNFSSRAYDRHTAAAVIPVSSTADGSVGKVFQDGVSQSYKSNWTSGVQGAPDGKVYIGNVSAYYEMYGVRIYSRALTAEEIAINSNIDKMRFAGAEPAELTWPEGYRWNADKQCVETFVEIAGVESATVSFDNETFETATNGWFALNQPVTFYARPAASQSLAAWTGLPDGAEVSDDKTSATFVVLGPISIAAVSHAPATLRWRGGANALASNAVNWEKDEGGAVALPPQGGDAVYLDKDSPSMTWDIDGVTLSSWTQDADYAGTVTFLTGPVYEGIESPTHGVLSADGKRRELVVTGDITLSGGTWKQQSTPSITESHPGWADGEGVYRIIARAGGNFTVAENAIITAEAAGFPSKGPGQTSHGGGAAHGGVGGPYGAGHQAYNCVTYGKVRAPVSHGSGSGGGGAIELSAAGDFVLNGTLNANGRNSDYYTAAGGSVFITAATLTGTGAMTANGRCNLQGAGGGGRVAVVLTGIGATFDGFTGRMEASTMKESSNVGTVYKETPSDRDEGGVLEIIGYGGTTTGYRGVYTLIKPTGEDLSFARIVLSNKVNFAIASNATVFAKELVSDSASNYIDLTGGTLSLPDGYAITNVAMRNDFYPSVLTTPSGATGTNVLAKGVTLRIEHEVTFGGTLHMLSGAKITQTGNGGTDVGYRANFSAENFILENGASVDVTAAGFSAGKGPGAPTDEGKTSRSGSHGGLAYDVGSVKAYGSITRPASLGSGGSMYGGGGATHIKVKHSTVVNGSVLASGDYWYFSGSGGSVWIETGTLSGASTGVISADGTRNTAGNDAYKYAGGGGGRIAVTLTDEGADFSGYLGTIRALGPSFSADGKNLAAGYGTVYLRKGGEAENEGTLIVNGPTTKVEGNFTDVTDAMTECLVGHVVITNCGNLRVRKGAELQVRKSFRNVSRYREGLANGEAGDDDHAPGAVAFVDASVDAKVTGTNLFMCLKCAEPGKTVRFGSAADTLTGIADGGMLSVAGTDGMLVCLRGLADGTAWLFDFHGKTSVAYADVMDSDARPGDKVSVDDTNVDSGNNQNWGFVGIKVGDTNVWSGAQNSSWTAAGNWSLERAPVDTDVIIIPAEAACSPEIAEALTLNRIEIAAGKALTLNGFSLTVTNGVDCLGSIVCTGSEVVTLDGNVILKGFTAANSTLSLADTRSRTVDLGGQTYNLVSVTGTEPMLSFMDGFSASRLNITCTAEKSVVFVADRTVTAGEFFFSGIVGGVPALTLMSNATGSGWNLKVTGKGSGSGVIVRDSHAVGQTVFAYNPSQKSGNNVTGWVFGISEETWTGGVSGDWGNPANWSGNAVPGSDSCVHFTSDATVTLDVDDATAQILDVTNCTVNLKGAKTLTVTSLLEILDGGTLEQAASNNVIHVLGSAYVRSGGTWTHTNNGTGAVDLGLGVNAVVDGDLTIDAGGKVSALGRGYYHDQGLGTTTEGASYGARVDSSHPACYGSIFRPKDLGSGGGWTADYAGGRIQLSVVGSLTVNGAIDADALTATWYNSSGGSILISCGRLAGSASGSIHADGGNSTSTHPGCGGRVAVYQTVATDFGGYAGKITAYGGNNGLVGGIPSKPAGTVYLQPAGMRDYCGTVKIANNRSTVDAYPTGGVDLPVSLLCPDDVKVYRNTTFELSSGGVLSLKADVTIRELELASASRLNLEGHTLTIISRAHKNYKGWPKTWGTGCGIFPGTDAAGNPGRIVWAPRGLVLFVK